jgi:tetratricopeptide (TPR) repeat protein
MDPKSIDLSESLRQAIVAVLDFKGKVVGTGFFVTSDGYILTCYHVIEKNLSAGKVDIRMAEGVKLEAVLKGDKSCPEKGIDFAILKIDGGPFQCLPLGINFGLDDKWYSLGYVYPSSYECDSNWGTIFSKPLRPGSNGYDIRLKTDLPIRGGLSGSPLLNVRTGLVVGIIKSKPAEDGGWEGFAVPMVDIFARWPELEKLNSDSSRVIKLPQVISSEEPELTQRVYRPTALPSPDVLAERGSLPPGHRMPFSPNAIFTGRKDDLLKLARTLLYAQECEGGPDQAGVVVCGMGGLGKSQLAVEFCYRYGRFFRGVHWLQANLDMQAEVAENGRAMDIPYWPDKLPEQVHATLRAWQEDNGRRLIVLDNAEDLEVLQTWLPKLRPAGLLITSRRENWPADMELKVLRLEVLSRSQSIDLMRKLAPRLKGESDEPLDNLADYLGDLPLALDLAGRYLADRSDLSVEGYLAELQEARSLLEHPSLRDWAEHSPTKHTTNVAATFTLSWQQLSKKDELAKRLFRLGGYCAPNTPIPRKLLAEAVGAYVPDHELDRALRKLDSLGLMDQAGGGRRMNSLLAEFARLQDRDAEESVLPALADSMVKLTTEALKSGLPENMKPLREHLDYVARTAEKMNLQITGSLWNNLGMCLQDLADYDSAKKLLKRALKIDEQVYGADHPGVAWRASNLGTVLRDLGDFQEARKYLERALKIDEQVYGPDHPTVAKDVNNLGLVLKDQGDLQEARKYLERALKIDEQVYGEDHPNVAIDVNNIGTVLKAQGDLEGARKCYDQALRIDEQVYGEDHPSVARYFNNIGMVLQAQGELREARNYFERALKIIEQAYGEDHPLAALLANNIGTVLKDQGDLREARKYLEGALKIDEQVYGPDHPDVARDVNSIGSVLKDQGDLQEARKCFERALKICQNRLGEEHPSTRIVRSNLELIART